MSHVQDEVQEFAALLSGLKERTDRSYGRLARRLHMNTSTLHRYCAGEAVPVDFAPVERFAALCGATAEERVELHRLWILAVAARRRPRTAPAAAPAAPATPAGLPATEDTTGEPGGTRDPAGAGRPRPRWYRRRRPLVALAVAAVLSAAAGSLAALPDGRSGGGDRATAAAPGTGAPDPAGPRSRAVPGPSATASAPSGGTGKPSVTPGGASTVAGGAAASPKGAAAAGVPLTWSADSHVWQSGCGHDYVVGRSPQQVPPPPAPQDARTWAAAQNAVHGRQTMVRISVQGKTSTAVVLEALRVRVTGRSAPAKGTAYAMDQGCGGAITPRSFDVDLDRDRPIARPVAGNDTGTPIPAMRLPYRVSAEDPEVLLVTAQTRTCDCAWSLELDWSSQGRTGTIRIDDAGRPFRTTGIEGLPRYMYDTSARAWVPYA